MLQRLQGPHGCCSFWKEWIHSTNCWSKHRWTRHSTKICFLGNIRDFLGHIFRAQHRRRDAHKTSNADASCLCLPRDPRRNWQITGHLWRSAGNSVFWVCHFKSTRSQATGTKLATMQLLRIRRKDVLHAVQAWYSTGWTRWSTWPLSRGWRTICQLLRLCVWSILFLALTRVSCFYSRTFVVLILSLSFSDYLGGCG